MRRGPPGCCDEEMTVPGDWAVRRPRPAPRRLGVRVRERQLPRHRRHRRGRARAAPRAGPRLPGCRDAAARAADWIVGMQSRTAAGGRSTPTTPGPLHRAAVLRLRRGHRPADGRRDRPRGRDARPATGCAGSGAGAAGPGMAARTTRSPTARGSAAGASTTSTGPGPPCPLSSPPGCRPDATRRRRAVAAGCSSTRTPTAAGARTCAPTSSRAGAAGARPPPPRPPGRCWRCWPPGEQERAGRGARRWLTSNQTPGRRLGRALVHGHRVSRGLLPQLPPVPARLPAQRARPLPPDAIAAGVSRILVVTALRTERAALRGHVAGAMLARTGMGPDRAARWRPGPGSPVWTARSSRGSRAD